MSRPGSRTSPGPRWSRRPYSIPAHLAPDQVDRPLIDLMIFAAEVMAAAIGGALVALVVIGAGLLAGGHLT